MYILDKFLAIVRKLSLFFSHIASWSLFILILLTVEQVLARYLFKDSSVALQEFQWYLFSLIFLFGAAETLRRNGHVRVDVFYNRFSQKNKRLVNILGSLFLLFPFCILIIYYGIEYTEQALSFTNPRVVDYYSARFFEKESFLYQLSSFLEAFLRKTILIGESSPNPGGLEAKWIIKAVIPFSFFLLALQGLVQFLEDILGKQEETKHGVKHG